MFIPQHNNNNHYIKFHPLLRVVFIHRCILFTSNSPHSLFLRSTVHSSWRDTIENYLLNQSDLLFRYNNDETNKTNQQNQQHSQQQQDEATSIMIKLFRSRRVLNPVFPKVTTTRHIMMMTTDPSTSVISHHNNTDDETRDRFRRVDRQLLLVSASIFGTTNPTSSFGHTASDQQLFLEENDLDSNNNLRPTIRETLVISKCVQHCCKNALLLPLRLLYLACPSLHEVKFNSFPTSSFSSPSDENNNNNNDPCEEFCMHFTNNISPHVAIFREFLSSKNSVFPHQQRAIPFFFACLSGNVEFVKSLLHSAPSVSTAAVRHNQLLNKEDSLIHLLVLQGHLEMLRFLVHEFQNHQHSTSASNDYNTNTSKPINFREFYFPDKISDKTPVDHAITSPKIKPEDRLPMLKLLLESLDRPSTPLLFSDINSTGSNNNMSGRHFLFTAVQERAYDCITTIVRHYKPRGEKRSDIERNNNNNNNINNNNNNSPLLLRGDDLLFRGDSVGGSTVFHVAARLNDSKAIIALLDICDSSEEEYTSTTTRRFSLINNDLRDYSRTSPFALACSKLNYEVANTILDVEQNKRFQGKDSATLEKRLNCLSFVGRMTPLTALCTSAKQTGATDDPKFKKLFKRMTEELGAKN